MQPRRPKKVVFAVTALIALALALSTVSSTFANLSGSNFEGNDGNLVVNTGGNTDWQNAPNRVRGDDLASGKTDNSFGQGTKEDDPAVSVVTGSIPPQKSDLTRFYIASEFANSKNFLYLAWERSNILGSANMDFEINKLAQPDLTTTGDKTLNRSAGDLLITFDFTNGGGNPVLGLLVWLTSGAGNTANQCFSSNALPCWGADDTKDALDGLDDNRVDLSAAGFAEGAVNTATVTDPIANVSLEGLEFGEAAIDLTGAGVFPAGTCTAFGSAFLKSRSSASFPAEVKDFVAPQPVNISNCGTLKVKKVTDPSPDPTDKSFSFSAGAGLSPASFNLKNGGVQTYTNVPVGSGYSVTETVPSNWVLVAASTSCDNGTGTLSGSTISNISVTAGSIVTCTFTNKLQLGAIKITKTSTKGNTALAGATFSIKQGGTAISGSPFTSDSNGVVCVSSLPFGSYDVKEESAPTGYNIDDSTTHTVAVDNNATCSDATYVGETTAFSDTPLSSIQVKFSSLAGAGVTKASIVCKDGAGAVIAAVSENGSADPAFDDTDETFTNLLPNAAGQSYTCLVVVDP